MNASAFKVANITRCQRSFACGRNSGNLHVAYFDYSPCFALT